VDLLYYYDSGRIFCARDYAAHAKIPRCNACDELIFAVEYTGQTDIMELNNSTTRTKRRSDAAALPTRKKVVQLFSQASGNKTVVQLQIVQNELRLSQQKVDDLQKEMEALKTSSDQEIERLKKELAAAKAKATEEKPAG
jgi:hypothetical protein